MTERDELVLLHTECDCCERAKKIIEHTTSREAALADALRKIEEGVGFQGTCWAEYVAHEALSTTSPAASAMLKALEAVKLLEDAEAKNANCPECEGEGVPELCGECFPHFDAARVARREVIALLTGASK